MEAPKPLLNDLTNLYRDINDELVSINFDAIELDFYSKNYNGVSDFASAFAEQLKKRADSLINSENDATSQEGNFITYIFFRYNECVLWDLSGNEEKFQDSLLKLNTGLTSRIIDDSCASEKLFLYVAELNFKVHNYTVARRFVEKSIKLENRQEDGADNVPLRFHKRCLQAFCYEYSFVPGAVESKCLKSNSLIDAVNCLIGRNPKDFVATNGCMVEGFKKVIKDFNHGNIKATDIIAKIYNPKTDSLAKKFYDSYINYLAVNQHEEYIKKIAHILAHCFIVLNCIAEKKQHEEFAIEEPSHSLWNDEEEFDAAVMDRLERLVRSDLKMARRGAIKKAETYLYAVHDTNDGKMAQVYERVVYELKITSDGLYNQIRNCIREE